jgi:O-antigen/teichoic acid export membrane protein
MSSEPPQEILATPQAGRRIIYGGAWMLGGNVVGLAIGIVTAALLLHHLGVAESGRYVTVLSLVSIAATIADLGVSAVASREMALRSPAERRTLTANVLGLRLILMPAAIALMTLFAIAAGYPTRMVLGTVLAGIGSLLVSIAHSFLSRLTVELRNAGWALIDLARQAVTLACVAVLVALGAKLTPFFAVLIVTGLVLIALAPLAERAGAYLMPRFDRAEQRRLLRTALPMAIALTLGELYFRLVILLMSLISSARQTGYYGASLRAMDSLIYLPGLIAGVAMPLLAYTAHGDRERMRYAVGGLSRVAVLAGILLVLATARLAEPVMRIIGGPGFGPAGAVLRIQVGAILFIALYQIWTNALLAVGAQRELVLTNTVALIGVAAFAAILVPPFGAQGGAIAAVLGDALLGTLIYWRLQHHTGSLMVPAGFLARVALAAAVACVPLVIGALPNVVAAIGSSAAFLATSQLVGAIPPEVHAAFNPRRLIGRRHQG